MVDFAVLPNT